MSSRRGKKRWRIPLGGATGGGRGWLMEDSFGLTIVWGPQGQFLEGGRERAVSMEKRKGIPDSSSNGGGGGSGKTWPEKKKKRCGEGKRRIWPPFFCLLAQV